MRDITTEMESLDEELKDAEHYAKMASKYVDKDPRRSDVYISMAENELQHAANFHNMLMKDTEEGREHNEYAAVMWEKVHNDYTDKTAKIKMMLKMLHK